MATCEISTEGSNTVHIVNNGATTKQAHVLMMPYPGLGHIKPLMDLARKLACRGVTITLISNQFIHDNQTKALMKSGDIVDKITLGHDVIPNGTNGSKGENNDNDGCAHVYELCVLRGDHEQRGQIRMMGIPDGLSATDHILHDVNKNCEAIVNYIPEKLLGVAKRIWPPITCVLADVFVLACTEAVAASLCVPHVGFWTQNAASYGTHLIFARDHAELKGLMMGSGEGTDSNSMSSSSSVPMITFIPGVPPSKPCEINTFLQPCDPSDFLFSFLMRCFESALRCSHILLNTFDRLEAESLEFLLHSTRPCTMLTVGPVLPPLYLRDADASHAGKPLPPSLDDGDAKLEASSTVWEEDDGCLAWLGLQTPRSVLYVSFGSIALIPPPQMAELAAALAASGYPILMVVREIDIAGKEAALPESFVRLNGGIVMVVKWAPQLKVLAHPAIGAFLSHCGWNSTLEAISKGVPILCWPHFGDQMLNCRVVVDSWNVGLDFQKDKMSGLVNREEIEAKVKFVMDPTSSVHLREQVHKLRIMAMEAYCGSSNDNLNLFTHFLLQ